MNKKISFGIFIFTVLVGSPWPSHGQGALPIIVQSDGSITSATGSGCNNTCSNVTFASQIFTPTVSADLGSIEVFTKDFGTASRNPDGNGCFMRVYDQGTGDMIAQSEQSFAGFGCAGDLTFTFIGIHPHLEKGSSYRWDFIFGGQNFTGLTFLGSPFDTVGGSFSVPPIVNAKFIALSVAPTPIIEPIVVVPGIMGSVLNRTANGQEVWPSVTQMLAPGDDSYLDDLRLSSSGTPIVGKEMNASSVIEAELGVPFYKNLLDTFKNDGYQDNVTLFALPYDWRLDVASATAVLSQKIAQAIAASPNGKIDIVAHSMGGVLVKNYLAGITDNSFLDKLIMVGVPQTGAPAAFKILNYGDSPVAFGPINILNPGEIKKIVQNMPSVYELLPTQRYLQSAGGYVEDFRGGGNKILNYAGTATFMTSNTTDSRNLALLNVANVFHQALDVQAVHASDVYNIVGCLVPTISGFNVYDGNVVNVTRSSGDGTVPEVSAMNLANGFANYFVLGNETGINHSGLVSDIRPLALIKSILEGNIASSSLPDGISTSTADCFTPRSSVQNITTVEFSTHSPVVLSLYDPAGHHTGPLPNGDVELGIPGSTYDAVGENSFITVPAFATYKMIAQGSASGTVTAKVVGYSGSAINKSVNYLRVPIQGSATKMELDFSGFDGNLGLKVDEDGDGIFENTVQPNAILGAASSSDNIPPAIIMLSPTSTDYIRSSTLPIRINVTDPGSGLGTTTIFLDGMTVTSTIIDLSSVALGPHTVSVIAIDNAGNPSILTQSFNVIVTPSSTASDIERCFGKGFILRKDVKDAFVARLQQLVVKIHGTRSVDKGVGHTFLADLLAWHNKRIIDDRGYRLLHDDVQWLIDKGPGK